MIMVVVVTGGIGSGKSEVCRLLNEYGAAARYDADERVKALYAVHPTLLSDISGRLGVDLCDENGNFVPRILAERIFSDPEALAAVESLVFPALIEDFEAFRRQNEDGHVVFESATVLEKEFFNGFGEMTVLLDAPYELRLERACARDGVSRQAIMSRMMNQKLMNALSKGHTDPRIDYVISNDGSFEELKKKVKELLIYINRKK